MNKKTQIIQSLDKKVFPLSTLLRPIFFCALLAFLGAMFFVGIAHAGEASTASQITGEIIDRLPMRLSGEDVQPPDVALLLEILFLLTILSLAPAIVMTMTSFTRVIIVFHFLRQAMGIQQIPPTQILASLAIFITVIIMFPVGKDINDNALQPYLSEQIGYDVALERAQVPIRAFMFKHTREKDLSIFYSIAQMEPPRTKEDVPTIMLVAAFIISELKTGFTIGFLIYIPFLVLDMVVSSILLAMGMMMLPPMMVSMPFKLLLFVMVDGWTLLIGSVVNSFLL